MRKLLIFNVLRCVGGLFCVLYMWLQVCTFFFKFV